MEKKFILLKVIILIILYLFPVYSSALQLEEKVIKVAILDQEMEVDALLKDGEILVPTRILTQILDAKLEWVPSLSILRIKYQGKEFLFVADDNLVQVDGVVKELKTPVLLEEGRTYLSFFCVANLLGYRLLEEDSIYRLERPSHQLQKVFYQDGEIFFTFAGSPEIHVEEDLHRELVRVKIFDVERSRGLEILGFTGDIPVERLRVDQVDVDRIVVTFYLNRWQEYFTAEIRDEDTLVFHMTPGATITQFSYDDERNRFVIVARGEMKSFSQSYLKDPHRLVIDLPTTQLEIEEEYFPHKHLQIEKVRLLQHEEKMVRVIFDMKEAIDFDFSLSPDGRFLVLEGEKRDLLIHDIAIADVGGRPEVVIRGTQSLHPEIFYLPEPHRLVLDFPYSGLNIAETAIGVDLYPISQIRASHYPGEKSRIVIDLFDQVDYIVKTDPLYPEKTVIAFPPGNFHIFLHDSPAATRVVIDTPFVLEYELHQHSYPYRLVVDLKETLLDISPDDIPTGNGMVDGVNLTHFSGEQVMTRLTFQLPYYSGHNIVSSGRNNRIEIDLFKSDLRNKVIYLDPGHGGADPGAVGITGTFEKDVVLDISLRLESLLQQAGARVLMSRRRDVFVDLYDRVEDANRSPADIFISIHANSVAHDFPMGTETYVSNNASPDSLRLAHLVQQDLVQSLGLYNRGVKKRDYYVIAATHIPAILVEVAFLSNPQEEALLKDPAFRQRSAEAIFSGIKKYFQSR